MNIDQITVLTGIQAGHEPHILDNVFDMHLNLRDKGTMRIDAWKFAK
jgi:acyl-CoA hydrolase